MATPITVGTTPIVAITKNSRRADVQFQNTGETTLYFYRSPGIPSSTNYEFLLNPVQTDNGNDDDDKSKPKSTAGITIISTDSTRQFNVVSSDADGKLAIYETIITYVI